jgi:hypothetical protein
MNTKSKEKDFQSLSPTMPCWHIDEGSHRHVGVNIKISLLLERLKHLQGVDHDMTQP